MTKYKVGDMVRLEISEPWLLRGSVHRVTMVGDASATRPVMIGNEHLFRWLKPEEFTLVNDNPPDADLYTKTLEAYVGPEGVKAIKAVLKVTQNTP